MGLIGLLGGLNECLFEKKKENCSNISFSTGHHLIQALKRHQGFVIELTPDDIAKTLNPESQANGPMI